MEKLIRSLEIYLADCVGKMPILYYSPDIEKLKIDYILSFNYTAIPTDVYPSLLDIRKHQIHGSAEVNHLAKDNDMVMGVNEYWGDSEKNFRTNFNAYKKFVQRIIKETGMDYKKALDRMQDYGRGYIYIFGHSLDVTDGDILREVILGPWRVTTIFYRNKQQQADQISNMSKVLGQDELIKRVFSSFPTIIFKQQADMVKRT